jgi:uncharacterized protein
VKRRLRKKLRKGEFQELGFEVRYACAEGLTDDACDAAFDRFILEAIEGNDLAFGGGGPRHVDGFVTTRGRGSVSEGQREAVERWLAACPEVGHYEIGPPVDAWHDW